MILITIKRSLINSRSLPGQILAFIVAFFIPLSQIYVYYLKPKEIQDSQSVQYMGQMSEPNVEVRGKANNLELTTFSWKKIHSYLGSHMKMLFSCGVVLKWSLLWILMEIGFRLIEANTMILWISNYRDVNSTLHYFTDAVTLFFSIGCVILASLVKHQKLLAWEFWIFLSCLLVMGCFAFGTGKPKFVGVSYVMYGMCACLYHFMVTTCSAMVAKHLSQESYGMIFGLNTWFSVLAASVFSVLLNDLKIEDQFSAFGFYYWGVFLIVIVMMIIGVILKNRKGYVM